MTVHMNQTRFTWIETSPLPAYSSDLSQSQEYSNACGREIDMFGDGLKCTGGMSRGVKHLSWSSMTIVQPYDIVPYVLLLIHANNVSTQQDNGISHVISYRVYFSFRNQDSVPIYDWSPYSRDLSHRICGSSWTWGSRNASMSLTCNLCKWWQKKSVTVVFTSKWDFPGYIQPSYYKISLLFVHILLVFICDRRKLWHMWFIYI
jgi:hypothetical protein